MSDDNQGCAEQGRCGGDQARVAFIVRPAFRRVHIRLIVFVFRRYGRYDLPLGND
jgi:hypothetical protein